MVCHAPSTAALILAITGMLPCFEANRCTYADSSSASSYLPSRIQLSISCGSSSISSSSALRRSVSEFSRRAVLISPEPCRNVWHAVMKRGHFSSKQSNFRSVPVNCR
uniref:Putative secreted protein n=1 Tax=Anopheles darlingi TaxID=43151 RepID=A0A2M4DPW7_ANODA